MIDNVKSTQLTIISEPVYVKMDCPYCESEIEIEYNEFSSSMYSDYWGDWEGELIYCEECEEYFKIGNVNYD